MLAATILIGIALTALLGGLVIAWWHGHRHLFSILFLASVIALAVVMTIGREPYNPKPRTTAGATQTGLDASTGSTSPLASPDNYAGGP